MKNERLVTFTNTCHAYQYMYWCVYVCVCVCVLNQIHKKTPLVFSIQVLGQNIIKLMWTILIGVICTCVLALGSSLCLPVRRATTQSFPVSLWTANPYVRKVC